MSYDYDYFRDEDLLYPNKPHKPVLGRNPSAIDARAYADAMEEYERELEAYKEDRNWYDSQMRHRQQELMDRLRDDHDVSEAQFDLLWNKAWEDGHSEGLQSVVFRFEELYEIASKFAVLEG
jgi:hypothetical protein